MSMEQRNHCWRGPRCTNAIREGDELVGATCDRTLCETCERAVTATLHEAPGLYVQIRNATLITGQTAPITDYVSTTVPGSKVLGNNHARHLGEQLHWLLTTWEEIVRDIAGLTPAATTGKREGRQITDATQLLTAYLTAWIAAPPTVLATSRWTDDTEQSGAAAAAALLDWKQAVRRALGHTKLVTRRTEPCMYCQVRAIVVHDGSDQIGCENCHRQWPRDEYLGKVRGFAPYLEKLGTTA